MLALLALAWPQAFQAPSDRPNGGFIVSWLEVSDDLPTRVRIQMDYVGPEDDAPRRIDTGTVILPQGTTRNAAAAILGQRLHSEPNQVPAAELHVVDSTLFLSGGVVRASVASDDRGVKASYAAHRNLKGIGEAEFILSQDLDLGSVQPTRAGRLRLALSGRDEDGEEMRVETVLAIADGWTARQLREELLKQMSEAGWAAEWDATGRLRTGGPRTLSDVGVVSVHLEPEMGFTLLGGIASAR